MNENPTYSSHEVGTFEEYTLYSLERSTPTLLHMMERSKQVASQWPDVMALMAAAGLCKELAGLASYQETLDNVFGFTERTDAVGAEWQEMRRQVKLVMDSLEDALNRFVDLIPVVARHVRENYMTEAPVSAPVGQGEDG